MSSCFDTSLNGYTQGTPERCHLMLLGDLARDIMLRENNRLIMESIDATGEPKPGHSERSSVRGDINPSDRIYPSKVQCRGCFDQHQI